VEVLAARGCRTASFGKQHVGESYPFRTISRGFHASLTHGGGIGTSLDRWGNDGACRIKRAGRTGIDLSGGVRRGEYHVEDGALLDETLTGIGGAGINPRRGVVDRGNTVTRTGSALDPRMHARGSGIWPWRSYDVLIAPNRYPAARGKADSY
jgi:hypothetical protein